MKRKIVLSLFALFLFLTIGTVAAVVYMSGNITQLKEIIMLHEVEELRRSLVIKIQNVQGELYTIDKTFVNNFDSIVLNALDLKETAAKCSSCHHDNHLTGHIEEVQSLIEEYEVKLSYYLTAAANAEMIQRMKFDAAKIGIKLVSLTEAMSHSASKNLNERSAGTMSRLYYVRIILFSTIIITFILGLIVAIQLTKSVTEPIRALLDGTRLISSGKLGSTISITDTSEFGELAKNFNTMSTAVKEGYDKIEKEISERRQAEKALRESEARFRAFFDMSPVGISIHPFGPEQYRKALKMSTFNPAFHEFFAYTRDELNEKTMEDITFPDDLDKDIQLTNELLSGRNDGYRIEKRYVSKSGETLWGFKNVTTLRSLDGTPSQIMTTLVDITESKRMEEEQMKIEKLESVGILAGGIAHDFNNIVSSILINLARAKMALDSGDDIREILADIEGGCRRTVDLTSRLITFSKGGIPIKKPVSIKEQLKDSALFALRRSNVTCKLEVPDDLWLVEADEGQINQVILNLLINAVQAMPDGGTITIKAENIQPNSQKRFPLNYREFVKIIFKDSGSGIPREHIKKIFDPFFTTKQKGSGLGLSSVYSILKNHDAYIDVESREGEGSTFYIYLPASTRLDSISEQAPLQGGGRILLMEDDHTLGETLQNALVWLGYEIALAKDGSEAIDTYSRHLKSDQPFNVVIMDLTISNGMGGREAIKELLKIDPDVKAIVSSGYSDDPLMSDFRKYGFCGVMRKPYEIEALHALLNTIIRNSAGL